MKIGYRSTSKASQSLQLIAFHFGANVPIFFLFYGDEDFSLTFKQRNCQKKIPIYKTLDNSTKDTKKSMRRHFLPPSAANIGRTLKKNLFARLRKKKNFRQTELCKQRQERKLIFSSLGHKTEALHFGNSHPKHWNTFTEIFLWVFYWKVSYWLFRDLLS